MADLDALFGLGDKVALVTGSSRGLGFAIAQAFLAAGARVMISSEDGSACAAARRQLSRPESDLRWLECDVSDKAQLQALVDETVSAFGGLDIVVANAGIAGPMEPSISTSEADYRRVMTVNLDSALQLCALAIPHLKRRGR